MSRLQSGLCQIFGTSWFLRNDCTLVLWAVWLPQNEVLFKGRPASTDGVVHDVEGLWHPGFNVPHSGMERWTRFWLKDRVLIAF